MGAEGFCSPASAALGVRSEQCLHYNGRLAWALLFFFPSSMFGLTGHKERDLTERSLRCLKLHPAIS